MSVLGDGLTVGVDIGTTSVKAVAVDAEGTVRARARVPHELRVPVPGAFEHDAAAAWRDGVVVALGQVAEGCDVAAVNVAAMVPSLTAVDADGMPLAPGLLYGDRRGAHERDEDRAGDAGELLAFLAWLAGEHPDAAGYWPAQAVANHALGDRGVIDSTTAATAYPLFDFTSWDAALAASAGVDPAALPAIVSGTEPAGQVGEGRPAAGALLGGGTIDALAEQLVAGADHPGDVLVLLGTTLIVWMVVEGWPEVPGLWTVPHTAPGLALVGGPSNAGGLFVDWVRRLAGDAPADGIDPGDVPVWEPYLRGERVPLHDPDRRADLHGLALHHGAAHVVRAAHEASGFAARRIIEGAGAEARRLVVSGGGTRSAGWVQALADTTGLPADVVAVPEGAALGSAFIARCAAGFEAGMTDAARWARTERTVEPDLAWVGPCAARYASW